MSKDRREQGVTPQRDKFCKLCCDPRIEAKSSILSSHVIIIQYTIRYQPAVKGVDNDIKSPEYQLDSYHPMVNQVLRTIYTTYIRVYMYCIQ